MYTDCTCGHPEEAHGNDPKHPGSTACEECGCIAYERDQSDDGEELLT